MEKQTTTPELGMGVTLHVGSDCYPYTVVWVAENKKSFVMRGCSAKMTSGNVFSEDQEYTYTEVINAAHFMVKQNRKGQWLSEHGNVIGLGYRRAYRDPSF